MRVFVLGLLLIVLVPIIAQAQGDQPARRTIGDSRGREFWVCFPQNARSEQASTLTLKLFVTGDRDTKGSVTVPGIGFRKDFSFRAGDILPVDIDSVVQVFGSDQVQKLGVHCVTDNDVAVFGLSTRQKSTDTYLAFPVNVLGTTYRAVGYYPPLNTDNAFVSQCEVVATEDHTSLVISLTADTRGGHKAGDTYTVELQKGDVYQLQGSSQTNRRSDLTGSLFTSSKPVSFFVGHSCAQIPADVSFCDQLLEMEPPIPSWGRQFYVGRLQDKTEYALRIVASENNTQVFVNNARVANLLAGEFYENNHAVDNAFITATKPVLVAEYAQGSTADSIQVGDPFMMLITPTEQFLPYYRFVTPIKGEWHHYINVVVPTDAISSLKVDGLRIPENKYHTIGITKFAIAQYEIGYGSHTVACDKPFGLYSYGFGAGGDNYDSYGNDGGQLVQTVPLLADTLRPTLELLKDDGNLALALIARDDRLFDAGLASITIIDSSNFRTPVLVPRFDVGTPQVPLTFRIRDTSACGFMSVKLVDGARNESYWVICRTKDGNRWTYQISEGRDNICPSCRSWTVQFVATPSYTVSDVTFEKPSYLAGCGTYNDFSTRLSGGFTGLFIYPFNKEITLAGGIGFSNITGAALAQNTAFAVDSILYGDTLGARRSKVVEQFTTEASFTYLTLNGGFYYYLVPEKVYTYFGLATGFLVHSSYIETSEILFPASLEYTSGRSGGERIHTLAQGSFPNPTSFHVALELSPGFQIKLNQKVSLLAGAYMNLPLFDAVKDLNWHLTTFGARIGLQYRH
jgi:hypothetical protein